MTRLLPNRKQWNSWSLPSKLTAIGTFVGVISLILTIGVLIYSEHIRNDIEDINKNLYTNRITSPEKFIIGSNNEILFGVEGEQKLKLNFYGKNNPDYLVIGYDTPNGMKFNLYNESNDDSNIYGVRLPVDFNIGFEEFGDLKEGYFIQACEHDFDKDNQPEIVIGVKNDSEHQINIFRFHTPLNRKDFLRSENIELIGKFDGHFPVRAFVENSSIGIFYGSQGLFEEFTYANSKFVKTQ